MSTTTGTAMASLVSSLADNKAALGRRYADWAVSAPTLESAVAAAAMAQDELGHARSTYPVLLFADWKEIKLRAEDILKRAAGRPGHIFNLGHGILPETPVENVKNLAKFVQEHSAQIAATAR